MRARTTVTSSSNRSASEPMSLSQAVPSWPGPQDRTERKDPNIRTTMCANRAFLGRVVRFLAGRCLRRSGAPGTVGGRRCGRGPTPDPARFLPLGHLVAGLSKQHARVEACSKGNFPSSQPRVSSWREGWRERRVAGGLA